MTFSIKFCFSRFMTEN
ncbi:MULTISPECIES: peptide IlvX [Klebsiella pneumoniae complex]